MRKHASKAGESSRAASLVAQLHARVQELERGLLRAQDLRSAFQEIVHREAAALPPEPPPIPPAGHAERPEPTVAMLDLADIHVGEMVTPEDTGGLNIYNLAECRARADVLVRRATDILARHPEVAALYVNLLGDVITGEDIYRGQSWHIDSPSLQQVFIAEELLLEIIRALAAQVPAIRIRTIAGNHGRVGRPGQFHPATNLDVLVYTLLARRLAEQDRISIDLSPAPWLLYEVPELNAQRHLLLHGDGIKSALSIPYYGVDRATREWGQSIDQSIQYVHLGHFHRGAQIQTPPGEQLISGSWVGATGFTLRTFREAPIPQQTLYVFGPDGLRAAWRIRLADRVQLGPNDRGIYTTG